MDCYKQNRLNEIVLKLIMVEANPDSVKAFAAIASKCLKEKRVERPKMAQVVKELENALELQLKEAALRHDLGKMQFGCEHYRSRCKLQAPCCNQILFPCRRCHDENYNKSHKMVMKDVSRVVCTICHTEQPAEQICTNCGVKMGEYFCSICKLYDDDTSKKLFHCDDCGNCLRGGRENFSHCPTCGGCLSVKVRGSHTCKEGLLKKECPGCHELLTDALKQQTITMRKCKHVIHKDCFPGISASDHCPICEPRSD